MWNHLTLLINYALYIYISSRFLSLSEAWNRLSGSCGSTVLKGGWHKVPKSWNEGFLQKRNADGDAKLLAIKIQLLYHWMAQPADQKISNIPLSSSSKALPAELSTVPENTTRQAESKQKGDVFHWETCWSAIWEMAIFIRDICSHSEPLLWGQTKAPGWIRVVNKRQMFYSRQWTFSHAFLDIWMMLLFFHMRDDWKIIQHSGTWEFKIILVWNNSYSGAVVLKGALWKWLFIFSKYILLIWYDLICLKLQYKFGCPQ